jgi:hypothetical protein
MRTYERPTLMAMGPFKMTGIVGVLGRDLIGGRRV